MHVASSLCVSEPLRLALLVRDPDPARAAQSLVTALLDLAGRPALHSFLEGTEEWVSTTPEYVSPRVILPGGFESTHVWNLEGT